ncbi:recombinase RecT [Streptomyces sp. NPDC001068]|uniref:recombinase RecT n=1 Tax=Streptomyces sp. NPDC001068 TaxID=3364544 RepID=UPI0036C9DD8C
MTETLMDRVLAATGGGRPAPEQSTVLAVEPPVGEATPAQVDAVQEYLDKHADKFAASLPKHVPYEAFRAAVAALLPRLGACTPASLRMALLTCARFGLVPDGYEAAIQVQGSKAVFVPRYQGYVRLMYRSGMVASVHCGLVHENDEWEVSPSAPAPDDFRLTIRPDLSPEERGKALFAYAFVRLTDGTRSQVVYVNRHKAAQLRDEWSYAYKLAEANGRKDSFWHRDFDHMMLKSGLKALFPWVPTSADLVALVEADDAGERGEVQIVHAPRPEMAARAAEAEQAHREAEGPQREPARLPVKRNKTGGRYRGKKQRGGRKTGCS